MKVYQWHREGMTIPDCCELLATNERYPVQAFRYGRNAFGFQFHPEVTLEMKQIWTLSAAERLKMPGAHQRGVHLAMHPLYDPPLDRWINGFLDRWLAADTQSRFRAGESSRSRTSRIRRRRQLAAAMARRGAMG